MALMYLDIYKILPPQEKESDKLTQRRTKADRNSKHNFKMLKYNRQTRNANLKSNHHMIYQPFFMQIYSTKTRRVG
jgi:hypothetical protein